jgi:hypothetical protein
MQWLTGSVQSYFLEVDMAAIDIEYEIEQKGYVEELRQAALYIDDMEDFVDHALGVIVPLMDTDTYSKEMNAQNAAGLRTYYLSIRGE